jgi:hypothetical protein
LALALGILIPQIPPQAVDDAQAWLAIQPGLFGQRNGLVRALGLFDVYHALWFRLLLVLTGLTLFVWLVESAELAWKATSSLAGRGEDRWAADGPVVWASRPSQIRVSPTLSADDVPARIHHFLVQRGYRWAAGSDPPPTNLVAGRREMFLWAQPILYGSLLVALIGLAITGGWGWQNEDWRPAPGDSQAIGHGSPYAVRLDAFDLLAGEDGRLCDFGSQITWLRDDTVTGQDMLGVGQPSTHRGIAVRQVGFVPDLEIRGRDDAGRQLALQVAEAAAAPSPQAKVVFSSPGVQPLVLVPSLDLFLVLTFEPMDAQGIPALRVDMVREGGGNGQSLGVLHDSGVLSAHGLRLEVDLAYRPVLRIDFRPAMGVVLWGGGLAVVALAAWTLASPRLVWLVLGSGEDNTTLVRVLVPSSLKGSVWLSQFDSQLRRELAGGD